MQSGIDIYRRVIYLSGAVTGSCAIGLLLLILCINSFRTDARKLHGRIEKLQEKLISAQITSSRLDRVQELISQNMAYSAEDSLAGGSSLSFLNALTDVLDNLGITLVELEPGSVQDEGRFVRSPYRLTLRADFEQFGKLVNMMEKSSRLISVEGFSVENRLEKYLNSSSEERCDIVLDISTLTLVRE